MSWPPVAEEKGDGVRDGALLVDEVDVEGAEVGDGDIGGELRE